MPTFYRVVMTDPPTEEDFLSHKDRGIPLRRDTPELRRSWEAVSVTSTLEAARALASRIPRLGSFIAVLDVPEDGPVQFERTLAAATHYDLRGEPRDMLATVIEVLPV